MPFYIWVDKKTGKQAMHYTCACCNKQYVAKDVQVDHVNPVVDTSTGFVSWDVYIDRLFCEKENLQVLCKPCHSDKTALEKTERKDYGKAKESAATRAKR
jgi:5-methylcytosine-specific restriction endonuclease McrA